MLCEIVILKYARIKISSPVRFHQLGEWFEGPIPTKKEIVWMRTVLVFSVGIMRVVVTKNASKAHILRTVCENI